jgi:ABC-type branched-subunit amino acid transport system ATPase component
VNGNGQPLLYTDDLVAGYVPEVDILNGVSIQVREGEIVTVIGPNGAGKSTLIKTIFGLLRPRRGLVQLRGEDITRLRPHSITRRGMSYVPQLDNVFQSLTVEENLELGSLDRARTAEQIDRMYELFPRLGERSSQTAGTMSGGERQMLAMGRALMGAPKLLMLDEPSLGLAPIIVADIFRTIGELRASGVSVLLVEQNAQAALRIADRAYVMELGEFILSGRANDVAANARVAASYLGFAHEGESAI